VLVWEKLPQFKDAGNTIIISRWPLGTWGENAARRGALGCRAADFIIEISLPIDGVVRLRA